MGVSVRRARLPPSKIAALAKELEEVGRKVDCCIGGHRGSVEGCLASRPPGRRGAMRRSLRSAHGEGRRPPGWRAGGGRPSRREAEVRREPARDVTRGRTRRTARASLPRRVLRARHVPGRRARHRVAVRVDPRKCVAAPLANVRPEMLLVPGSRGDGIPGLAGDEARGLASAARAASPPCTVAGRESTARLRGRMARSDPE